MATSRLSSLGQGCPSVTPVPDDLGKRIAARAIGHIGAPFRLHGRCLDGGFDCIGLAADALLHVGFSGAIPNEYSLRGHFGNLLSTFFEGPAFVRAASLHPGDFVAVRAAPRQLHLLIATDGGFVHAHAGLRRVVLTPRPLPWPTFGHWRYVSE